MTRAPQALERWPVIPQPPHDPTSLLIDERTGWQLAEVNGLDGLETSACDASLTLRLGPSIEPQFTDASGSFGGLVPPANMAVTPACDIFLLDRETSALKRFDPCCCRFVEVPCVGRRRTRGRTPVAEGCHPPADACATTGAGGARQFRNPGGIAVCCHELYVCDTGRDGRTGTGTNPYRRSLRARIQSENHRVSVFQLPGLELRAHLRPPHADFPRWRPVAVACDARGTVWVADTLNGAIHPFVRHRWSASVITGLGQPEHLAVDCQGRLWVIERPASGRDARLRLFDTNGGELPAPSLVRASSNAFASLPFHIHPNGTLDLRCLCTSSCEGTGTFDANGNPVDPPAPPSTPYLTSGTYISRALDSRTRQCQWHRVRLIGDLPLSTRVRVETFCADEEYDADQIAGFAVWSRQEISGSVGRANAPHPPLHDCLVPSPPGRFLWLRLTFLGNGTATPIVHAIEIEFPRLTSLRYLPAVFAAEPVSADFTSRFLSLFDTTMRGIEREVDREARFFDPAATPAERVGEAPVDFLTWLASWIGVTFDRMWSEARRRRFLANAGALFGMRGTVNGLRQQLLHWLGWDPPGTCGIGALRARTCARPPLNCAAEPQAPAFVAPPLILEHFKLRRWLHLGVARLGAQAVLWGQRIINRTQLDGNAQAGRTRLITTPDPLRDPLHFYAHGFTVFIPACAGRTESERRSIENLMRRESPAHTRWNLAYVEPRFRIGVQSMIGFDAVVACLPPSMRLAGQPLGVGTLIAGSARRELRAGRSGRIGTGSQLN